MWETQCKTTRHILTFWKCGRHSVKLQDLFLLSGSVGSRHSVKLQDIFLLSGSVGSRHSVKLQDIFLLSGSVGDTV